jgi:hypothetical protein
VLLSGLFILDLLVIHPFEDGNGRVARLLTGAMLSEHGYTVGRYVVARQATGYERGTITPLGSVRRWPVIADERMRGREITLGAGEHGLALAVDADEILQALNASVADISDPEPAT